MRLIDIKNIEDTYKSIKSYLREYTPSRNTDAMIGGMKRLMAEINNIEPTITCCKTHDNWVPVSERLPEDREKVLISTKWGYVGTIRYEMDSILWDNDITAWMPLPEPYKEVNNNGK